MSRENFNYRQTRLRLVRGCRWLSIAGILLGSMGVSLGKLRPGFAVSIERRADTSNPIRPHTHCPDNLEDLMPLLLRDLPSYVNRVTQRAIGSHQSPDIPGTLLLAGQPDYAPLSLGPGAYQPGDSLDQAEQVFFTTLERQYVGGESLSVQRFHWVFLTQSDDSWYLVLMLSSLGGETMSDHPPSPPIESSQGAIAQGIRLWLRDCRTGNIDPL